jgi:CubicO group peptidase (beta-lactamase class C family)
MVVRPSPGLEARRAGAYRHQGVPLFEPGTEWFYSNTNYVLLGLVVPPLNQPPLKGDLAYGIGLGKDHGWVGHNGEIPGYNTYLFYHPDLDAVVVVEVNSDISSGKCPKGVPIMKEWPRSVPCELPADRIFEALAEALGKPSPSPPESST